MRRRRFIGSIIAGASAGAGAAAASAATVPTTQAAAPRATTRPRAGAHTSGPMWYELRTYHLRIGPQKKLVEGFLGEAFIPALNRLGVKTVGVFELMFGSGAPALQVLVPHASAASFAEVETRLPTALASTASPAATAYLAAPAERPAYERIERQLLAAMPAMPGLELPADATSSGTRTPRIFELRTYESPGEAGHEKKMQMFTPAMGELDIFRRVGLTPVFFGQALTGARLPNFTYMLTFPDLAAREQAWANFRSDPAWQKLRATPGYSDPEIMSNISDLVLRRSSLSQI